MRSVRSVARVASSYLSTTRHVRCLQLHRPSLCASRLPCLTKAATGVAYGRNGSRRVGSSSGISKREPHDPVVRPARVRGNLGGVGCSDESLRLPGDGRAARKGRPRSGLRRAYRRTLPRRPSPSFEMGSASPSNQRARRNVETAGLGRADCHMLRACGAARIPTHRRKRTLKGTSLTLLQKLAQLMQPSSIPTSLSSPAKSDDDLSQAHLLPDHHSHHLSIRPTPYASGSGSTGTSGPPSSTSPNQSESPFRLVDKSCATCRVRKVCAGRINRSRKSLIFSDR